MKTIQLTLLAIIFTCSIAVSYGQKKAKSEFDQTKVLVIGVTDKDNEEIAKIRAIKYFHQTLRKGRQQVGMPQFLITDKQNKAIFTIGGFVQFRTAYDFNDVVNNKDFVTYNIPMSTTAENQQRLLMDGSTSRLYFKTLVFTKPVGTVEAYIETDFRGGDNVLRLREAYVKFLGITLGQTISLMTDINSSFNTIDFQGPNAYTYARNLGIHYNLMLGKGFEMAIGAEYPVVSATAGSYAKLIPQRIPDIPLYFQYNWDAGMSHIRATGILRNMYYQDQVNNSIGKEIGYGVQLSTSIKISKRIQFYGNAVYGKGIGQYINDLSGNNMDLIPSIDKNGKLITPETFAWLAGAQFNVVKRLPVSIGYSQVRQYGNQDINNGASYKLSQYIVANAFYNINGSFSMGVEYLYGTRYDHNNTFGRASRVQAMAQFNF